MYKVKQGKEKTCILGIILGEASQEDLKRLFENGDTRFIEMSDPPKRKPKKKKEEQTDKE